MKKIKDFFRREKYAFAFFGIVIFCCLLVLFGVKTMLTGAC